LRKLAPSRSQVLLPLLGPVARRSSLRTVEWSRAISLKVVDEYVVDGRTAERADNWDSLRRELLGNNDAETGSDLRY
jgi:hypothetical protein